MQTVEPQLTPPGEIQPESSRGVNRIAVVAAMLVIALAAGLNPAPIRAAWAEFERIVLLKSEPLPASPAVLSEHEIAALGGLAPQEQATLLMERAIRHYSGAIERIDQQVPGWFGRLDVGKGRLSSLLDTAVHSNDLRVRAASLEIYLAAYNLPKSAETVDQLVARLETEPEHRAWLLWILGVLGNRGVEAPRIETVFLDRIHAPDETTRSYAVVGLGLLASDSSIPALLAALREDPLPQVRERAASSLAQSGMFTPAQRLRAVPELLRMMDDASLDATTRSWVFQALGDITGASFGSDPAQWRNWWSSQR